MPAGKIRQRAFSPKNRSGCKTCKIRKVKCDEEKPHCKRCTSTGRTCDGYDSTWTSSALKATQHGSRNRVSPSHELIRSRMPSPLAPSLQLDTAQDRESYDFFINHAVPSLRGVLSSPFWQREVLQAAHRHPSIQYGILALGAMHKRYQQGSSSHIEKDALDKHLHFALQQSNRAIRGLVDSKEANDANVVTDKRTLMACCILFNSMACLQGHQREALQHLRSGLRILEEVDDDDESAKEKPHPIDIESLRSIFVGLDMQARSIMSQSDILNWEPLPRTSQTSTFPSTELNDTSLLAMLRSLESLQNHVLAFLQGTNARPQQDTHQASLDYLALKTRFDTLSATLSTLSKTPSPTFTRPLAALFLLHSQIEYFLHSPRSDLSSIFAFMHSSSSPTTSTAKTTKFNPISHFTKMMTLITSLLPSPSEPITTPVYTTTTGPLSALWLIATRAPSTCTALRRRAVHLMLRFPRREGHWDGLLAGQIAHEALRLEQEGAREVVRGGGDVGEGEGEGDLVVPEELRIVVFALRYHEVDGRRARVQFRSLGDMRGGGRGVVKSLSW